ncbi:hypothetical protein PTT_10978 [Pyrenophora teres f. teres 0-1]|uniref:Uncharacterized protein n=1 Tax=Pyrenophora teres f. teres (strain 0-1) TaxID=861557 RepID=E3RQH7_PYRTT|nr:hypothetical protein PTT_10978 [Pyrenophora teres f. teres 0-1]
MDSYLVLSCGEIQYTIPGQGPTGIGDQMNINIMDLGEEDMLIGYDWLIKHNPAIDWLRKKILG